MLAILHKNLPPDNDTSEGAVRLRAFFYPVACRFNSRHLSYVQNAHSRVLHSPHHSIDIELRLEGDDVEGESTHSHFGGVCTPVDVRSAAQCVSLIETFKTVPAHVLQQLLSYSRGEILDEQVAAEIKQALVASPANVLDSFCLFPVSV